MSKQTAIIKSVEKSLKVLLVFEQFDFQPLDVKQIIKKTKLKPNSVYRILATFEASDICKKDEQNRWRLGARVLRLSESFHKYCLTAIQIKI